MRCNLRSEEVIDVGCGREKGWMKLVNIYCRNGHVGKRPIVFEDDWIWRRTEELLFGVKINGNGPVSSQLSMYHDPVHLQRSHSRRSSSNPCGK